MTEQEQKAFDQMREALENIAGDKWPDPEMTAEEYAREALTAIKQAQQAQEPVIDYTVLYQFAEQQGISYNKLCTAVQMCLIHPAPKLIHPHATKSQ